MLGHYRRVLVIGAHPDDEDTELLTLLVRGDGAEAAYLSLNRGEGGQNLIGPELGEALGLLRTEELLAARRLDGARQYFTRAYDFGYSKSLEETWSHWPQDTISRTSCGSSADSAPKSSCRSSAAPREMGMASTRPRGGALSRRSGRRGLDPVHRARAEEGCVPGRRLSSTAAPGSIPPPPRCG